MRLPAPPTAWASLMTHKKNKLDQKEILCQKELDNGRQRANVCFDLVDDIVRNSDGSRNAKWKVSQYDSREWEPRHGDRNFPPGHKDVEAYLGAVAGNRFPQQTSPKWDVDSNAVLESIHASQATTAKLYYRECTDPPYNALANQDGVGVIDELVRILENSEENVHMMFFNGVNDLICNHVGNEILLEKLPWSKAKDWMLAERFVWRANGKVGNGQPAGYMKQFENLSFLKVLNSGHMVPMDQPSVALEMMTVLLSGKSFEDDSQDLPRAKDAVAAECLTCPPVVECPQSNTVQPISENVENKDKTKSYVTEPTMDSSPVNHFVIALGWMGAVLACVAVAFYAVIHKRRVAQQAVVVVSADDNMFDVEVIDMDNEKGIAEMPKYRDRPLGVTGGVHT